MPQRSTAPRARRATRSTARPVVRSVTLHLTDLVDEAFAEILRPLDSLRTRSMQRWLLKQILAEGIYALADRKAEDGRFRFDNIRFDVANGDRRGLEREETAARIDAVLEQAQSAA